MTTSTKRSTRVLKNRASGALKGKMGIAVASSVLVTLAGVAASYLTLWLFPGNGTLDLILGEVFSFGLMMVLYIVQVGMYRLYLNIARGKEFSLGDLMYFFRSQPDRILTGCFPMAVISWLANLPAVIYQSTAVLELEPVILDQQVVMTESMMAGLEQQARLMMNTGLINLAGLLAAFLVTMPMVLAPYILADEKTETGLDAIRESVALMKGNYVRYILLNLSFVPLVLATGIFTLGIALLLWVIPFLEMSRVMFYRDVSGELDRLLLGEEDPV